MEGGVRRKNWLYGIVKVIGHICFHSLYHLTVEGREKIPREGPGIILPKHQFWTDIPIVGLSTPKPLSYIAKQELFIYPIIRPFLIAMGGVPVDRSQPIKSLDSFRYVEQLLKKGEFIVLFPEGTYYPDSMGGGKHRFIQRLLRLQDKMGWSGAKRIPFIPMGIRYRRRKLRTEVRVKIGAPLYANGEEDGQEITQKIIAEIAKLSALEK